METRVGRKVSAVGLYSVMRKGDRFYVLSPDAREIGDCTSLEAATELAGFLAPETAMERELALAGAALVHQDWEAGL